MTTPMFPYAVWQSGTTQNSIPANDNSLRNEIIAKAAQGVANAAPSAPAEGSVYVVGTPWGTFSTDDVVLFRSGTWYGFAPFTGWLKYLEADNALYLYDGGWSVFSGGGGGGGGVDSASNLGLGTGVFASKVGADLQFKSLVAGRNIGISSSSDTITIAAPFSQVTAINTTTHDITAAESGSFLRFTATTAKTVTFRPNTIEDLPANAEWHLRNVGAQNLTITPGAGVTLNPPFGGTLIVPTGGTVTVKRAASDIFDVMGQTT